MPTKENSLTYNMLGGTLAPTKENSAIYNLLGGTIMPTEENSLLYNLVKKLTQKAYTPK